MYLKGDGLVSQSSLVLESPCGEMRSDDGVY